MSDEREYNLLDEKWIRVITSDDRVEMVSLEEAFRESRRIKQLYGDTAPQDASILRLMLAIMYCVYLRDDLKGVRAKMECGQDAMDLWSELWNNNDLDSDAICDYLEGNRDGFYLFHPTRPFYQTPMEGGTSFPAFKFNGSLSQSKNKVRLFSHLSGDSKDKMDYADASRWTVYSISYDDCSAKGPSPKKSWVGSIGMVIIEGDNLFETLMLNFPLADHRGELYESESAPWEMDYVRPGILQEIPIPLGPIGLLTMQCRHIILEREGGKVTGVRIKAGAFIEGKDALIENMTSWYLSKDGTLIPRKHNPSRSIWRDYQSLLLRGTEDDGRTRIPGTVMWLSQLRDNDILPRMMLRMKAVGIEYDSNNSSISEIINDNLSINSELLSELGVQWNRLVDEMVQLADSCVYQYSLLMDELATLDGRNDVERTGVKEKAKQELYSRLDAPFRNWISKIDPETSDRDSESRGFKTMLESLCIGISSEALENSTHHSRNSRAKKDSDKLDNAYIAVDRFRSKIFKMTRGEKR